MTKDDWDGLVKIVGILTGGALAAYGMSQNYDLALSAGNYGGATLKSGKNSNQPSNSIDDYVHANLQFFNGLMRKCLQENPVGPLQKILRNPNDFFRLTWQNINGRIFWTHQCAEGIISQKLNELPLSTYDLQILQNLGGFINLTWQNVNGGVWLTWNDSNGLVRQMPL